MTTNPQYLISTFPGTPDTYMDITGWSHEDIEFAVEQHELHGREVYYQNFAPDTVVRTESSIQVTGQPLILKPLSVLLNEQRLQGNSSASHETNAPSGNPVARVK